MGVGIPIPAQVTIYRRLRIGWWPFRLIRDPRYIVNCARMQAMCTVWTLSAGILRTFCVVPPRTALFPRVGRGRKRGSYGKKWWTTVGLPKACGLTCFMTSRTTDVYWAFGRHKENGKRRERPVLLPLPWDVVTVLIQRRTALAQHRDSVSGLRRRGYKDSTITPLVNRAFLTASMIYQD